VKWTVVVVVTRGDQPKPPAVANVRQNGLSSASCRASVTVTPVSRQIWWIQVVGGRPLARLHSCKGRSPSLILVQIRRIWFAGTSLRSLATWPNRPSLRLRTMYEQNEIECTVRIVPGYWRWGWTILWWLVDTKPYSVAQHSAPGARSQLTLSHLALKPQDHIPPDNGPITTSTHLLHGASFHINQTQFQEYNKVLAKLSNRQTIGTSNSVRVTQDKVKTAIRIKKITGRISMHYEVQ